VRVLRRVPLGVVLCAAVVCGGCASLPRARSSWWGKDKALHLGLSAAIAGGAYAGMRSGGAVSEGEAAVSGFAIGFGAGYAKEVHDAGRPGGTGFDLRDLFWDLVGACVGVGLAAAAD